MSQFQKENNEKEEVTELEDCDDVALFTVKAIHRDPNLFSRLELMDLNLFNPSAELVASLNGKGKREKYALHFDFINKGNGGFLINLGDEKVAAVAKAKKTVRLLVKASKKVLDKAKVAIGTCSLCSVKFMKTMSVG